MASDAQGSNQLALVIFIVAAILAALFAGFSCDWMSPYRSWAVTMAVFFWLASIMLPLLIVLTRRA